MTINNQLLIGLNETEIEKLHPVEKTFQKGETIICEGTTADRFGIVLSGHIKVVSADYYGNNNIILSGKPGFVFGESLIILGIKEYPVSVIASTDCSIMLFKASSISNGMNNKFCLNLMKVMAKTNIEYRKRITILIQRKTREKILKYLADEARKTGSNSFDIPFDRQALADYLGVERSAMSAELSKLISAGLLETRKNHFTLK